MRALILAAGRGSRLGPYTDDRPKCLVEVGGRSLLDRHLDTLAEMGVTETGIVTGYRAADLAGRGPVTFHAPRWSETNMVVSLTAASAWLRAAPTLVLYGDVFATTETVAALAAAPGDLAITYDPHWLDLWSRRFAAPLDDAETFRLRADGTLAEIGRRAASTDEIQGQYMGLLRFTPAVWGRVEEVLGGLAPQARDALDMTALLRALIASGELIRTVPRIGPWGEVDSPDDVALYDAQRRA
ncbi:phosphocholine cytidylyltransferase family protein [Streptomyces puniciscabiei]|uniref:phosphocholine cytidylyltransferase family protein n=1 Tax=Streptomyces puniciscabiei TaxID=164348 RepID=UPI003334682D